MIDRAAELIVALSGARSEDPRLALISERLRGSGARAAHIADAIVGALEEFRSADRGPRGWWSAGTAGAAAIAAVFAWGGLSDLFHLLRPWEGDRAAMIPLLAVPLAALAFVARRRSRRRRDERSVLELAVPIARAGVPAAAAFEAACFIAGVGEADTRARACGELSATAPDWAHLALLRELERPRGFGVALAAERASMLLPGAAAAWVVLSYWILYSLAISAHAASPWFER